MAIIKKLKPLFLILSAAFFAYLAVDYIEMYSEEKINKHLVLGLIFGLGAFIKASDLYILLKNKKSEQVKSEH